MIVRLGSVAGVLAAGESREHRVGVMAVVAVSDGPNQRGIAHATRRPGQVFTDLNTRHRRRDWLELATDVRRGLRLQVEHVDVARAAKEIDEYDRVGGCRPSGRDLSGVGRLQETRQGHRRKQRQPSDAQQITPGPAVTRPRWSTKHPEQNTASLSGFCLRFGNLRSDGECTPLTGLSST